MVDPALKWLTEFRERHAAHRKDAMSGDYGYLIGASAEFIRDQTGIELDSSYRLEHG